MQDAAHTMTILDIITSALSIEFCHKAIYTALQLKKSFKKFLWLISESHSEIPKVSQGNGE